MVRMIARGAFGLRDALVAIGIASIAVVIYLPALGVGFLADDFMILARLQQAHGLGNAALYFQQGFFEYYRPLPFLSHAMDWQVWAGNPAAFHSTSIALHALNSVLVFLAGRRWLGGLAGTAGALLFATHPASHEAVYWIAARFDLMATAFTLLALLLLTTETRIARICGASFFFCALLSKESAVALPAVTVAFDVFVLGAGIGRASRRLVPLIVALTAYFILRAQAGDLPLAADARGHGKALVLAFVVAGVLALARADWRRALMRVRTGYVLAAVGVTVLVLAMALIWPLTTAWVQQKLGFVSFAAFYLFSPVLVPARSPAIFAPASVMSALPGLAVVACTLGLAWRYWRALLERPTLLFLFVMLLATLVPVSSLTGSPRYVYVATVALSLLVGAAYAHVAVSHRVAATGVLTVFIGLSLSQLAIAGASWRWAGAMVRDGVSQMSASLEPCGTRDLVLLTAPVAIRGVYTNFYWDAFQVAGCTPREILPLLRVERTDAAIRLSRLSADTLELRVADYQGNFVTSRDLRHFDVPIHAGEEKEVRSPMGRLRTYAAGTEQVFRIEVAPERLAGSFFYYAEGRMAPVP